MGSRNRRPIRVCLCDIRKFRPGLAGGSNSRASAPACTLRTGLDIPGSNRARSSRTFHAIGSGLKRSKTVLQGLQWQLQSVFEGWDRTDLAWAGHLPVRMIQVSDWREAELRPPRWHLGMDSRAGRLVPPAREGFAVPSVKFHLPARSLLKPTPTARSTKSSGFSWSSPLRITRFYSRRHPSCKSSPNSYKISIFCRHCVYILTVT